MCACQAEALEWIIPAEALEWISPSEALEWISPAEALEWISPAEALEWISPAEALEWISPAEACIHKFLVYTNIQKHPTSSIFLVKTSFFKRSYNVHYISLNSSLKLLNFDLRRFAIFRIFKWILFFVNWTSL